jgi:hypothetical protein
MAKFGAAGGYVTGRPRKKGEMNGKSANVNNVLKNYIFTRCGRQRAADSRRGRPLAAACVCVRAQRLAALRGP